MYLSHKAVHSNFDPPERHEGMYSDVTSDYPPSMKNTESNYRTKPEWVKEQRFSWHGVDHVYHGRTGFDRMYWDYAESLMGLDESTGTSAPSMEMAGTSFLGLLEGGAASGPDQNRAFLYEYYWEHAFPHTPTAFALRGDRFKYVYYHGV